MYLYMQNYHICIIRICRFKVLLKLLGLNISYFLQSLSFRKTKFYTTKICMTIQLTQIIPMKCPYINQQATIFKLGCLKQ